MAVVAEIPEEVCKALEGFRPTFRCTGLRAFPALCPGTDRLGKPDRRGDQPSLHRTEASQFPQPFSHRRNLGPKRAQWGPESTGSRPRALSQERGGWPWTTPSRIRPARRSKGVGIYWDHSEKRYVLAHNIVTAEFVNPNGESHPLDFRLYLKEDQSREKRVPFKTKIELAQELVETALHLGLDIQGALFDSWFASKEFIKFLRGKGLRWVTRLKADRNIKIKGKYVAIGRFADTLPRESFRKVSLGDRIYQVFSKAVDLKGVGQVRILISYDNEEFSGSPAFFATDQIRWEGTRILKTYSKRWEHRDVFPGFQTESWA